MRTALHFAAICIFTICASRQIFLLWAVPMPRREQTLRFVGGMSCVAAALMLALSSCAPIVAGLEEWREPATEQQRAQEDEPNDTGTTASK